MPSDVSGKIIRIGGASGYWGESAMATPQLLTGAKLDYLVYDYLAEITMSIMARAKAKDPTKGYATDFVETVMRDNLEAIATSGVKIISNAGGVNPTACGEKIRAMIAQKGLDLKVAIITGDDIVSRKSEIVASKAVDMFSRAPMPEADKIMSANLYLGAFPIAAALEHGADIIITGRCVDSAVSLGACIYEFGWGANDWDLLASGSLAGHILECGPQATGGNYTDWQEAGDISKIGYPIAEISADGSFVTTKPDGTGGCVTIGTVSEQMLYEIGDPQAYMLPDVICDFSDVTITQIAKDRVKISPAKGRPAPNSYKTCLTYRDGFRAGSYATFYGVDARLKAEKFSKATLERASQTLRRYNLGPFSETSQEIIGGGSQMGGAGDADGTNPYEVILKLAVKHPEMAATGIFLKEMAGMGLATPPGLSGFTGVRGKPSPVVRLISYLTPKTGIKITIDISGKKFDFQDAAPPNPASINTPASVNLLDLAAQVSETNDMANMPLIKLAWGRSGDKGNKANIGIIARKPEFLPYIAKSLSPDFIAQTYAHFLEPDETTQIHVYVLPGAHALNILIDDILGGGGAASLRNDAQGKGYAQIMLAQNIKIPRAMVKDL